MVVKSLSDVRAYAANALDKGAAQTGFRTVSWHTAGKCERPHRITLEGRGDRRAIPPYLRTKKGKQFMHPHAETQRWVEGKDAMPLWLDVDVRCRKCPDCLKARAALWRRRAFLEINAAQRTWFGTLTLSPESHYLAQCEAERTSGVALSSLTEDEQFAARHAVVSRWLTLFIKRLRKKAGEGLRLMIVAEPHKNGLPHYHAFLHEQHGCTLTHRELLWRDKAKTIPEWEYGDIVKWKLVDSAPKGAWYVSKYLAKSSVARVRASFRYGHPPTALKLKQSTGAGEVGSAVCAIKAPAPPPSPTLDRVRLAGNETD